jgi:phosphatidylglycerophosphate synthase
MTKDLNVRLIGAVPARLWGLEATEWQRRAWTKAGAATVSASDGNGDGTGDGAKGGTDARLLAGTDWVLSPALQRALIARPGAALIATDGKGVARIAALHLPEAAVAADHAQRIGQADPDRAALRAAGFHPGGVEDFAGAYDEALRKREAPYALSLRTESVRAVEKRLFKGAYKGVTDLVTKYAWPWPAFHATRWAAMRQISPNTVTTASLVLVGVAFWFFWHGLWAPGILAAWAMTFLDTVDGKLARTTMSYSKWGNVYDHGIDLIHPPFWYWAIWHGLVATGAEPAGLLLASLWVIIAGYVLNRIEEGIFMRRFGFHIHIWRRIDSIAREITARRNPNMVIFMVAVIAGQPGWGLVAVAVWTLLWLVFHGLRLVQALAAPSRPVSWMQG